MLSIHSFDEITQAQKNMNAVYLNFLALYRGLSPNTTLPTKIPDIITITYIPTFICDPLLEAEYDI